MLVHRFFFLSWCCWSCSRCGFYLQEEIFVQVAVRACARFPGWELHAHSARLVVHISNKGIHPTARSALLKHPTFFRTSVSSFEACCWLEGHESSGLTKTCKRIASISRRCHPWGWCISRFRPLRLLSFSSSIFLFFSCTFCALFLAHEGFEDGDGVRGIPSVFALGTSKRPEVVSVLYFFIF